MELIDRFPYIRQSVTFRVIVFPCLLFNIKILCLIVTRINIFPSNTNEKSCELEKLS